ncbi:CotO family spore coat protein [Bacillaceae bacterium CLA-AA-H227]|uniref:CotO family spore coat protein n=1 Tax=Robertmurraya yapensis (ex Hitch et al 2024) TaxID=3133160 RepID=A0ACC6S7H2_9BACI|nr:CotO family spore coat protein [Bacillus yapensis]
MNKEQKKREPLLYIHQPGFKFPEGIMQKSFSAKKVDSFKEETKMDDGIDRKSRGSLEQEVKKRETTLTSKEIQQTIEDYEQAQTVQEPNRGGFGLRRLKSFKEMDLVEKLDYLERFPPQLPPIPCIFTTENGSLRGTLVEKNLHDVVVRLFDKKVVTIAIKDLAEVKMIGFR